MQLQLNAKILNVMTPFIPPFHQVFIQTVIFCTKGTTIHSILCTLLSIVLRGVQIFGLMSVSGFSSPDPTNIKFRWLSLRHLLTIAVFLASFLQLYAFWMQTFERGLKAVMFCNWTPKIFVNANFCKNSLFLFFFQMATYFMVLAVFASCCFSCWHGVGVTWRYNGANTKVYFYVHPMQSLVGICPRKYELWQLYCSV